MLISSILPVYGFPASDAVSAAYHTTGITLLMRPSLCTTKNEDALFTGTSSCISAKYAYSLHHHLLSADDVDALARLIQSLAGEVIDRSILLYVA